MQKLRIALEWFLNPDHLTARRARSGCTPKALRWNW
jgi:hypothetical protein